MTVILAISAMAGTAANAAGPTTVGLGTATSFAVLAGSGITNTGPSVINGDIGSFPTASITGFPPGTVIGTNHAGDAVTQGAKTDLTTAYNDAAGRTPVTTVPTELGGTTLTPGVYNSASGTFGITGSVTLDGQGDPNAVFIFKMASTLTTATASSVTLINRAQSCNVFWQVGSSATIGTSTTFRGNILALTSITLVTGATIDGRALAMNGAVTMDTNTITKATCAAPPTGGKKQCQKAEKQRHHDAVKAEDAMHHQNVQAENELHRLNDRAATTPAQRKAEAQRHHDAVAAEDQRHHMAVDAEKQTHRQNHKECKALGK